MSSSKAESSDLVVNRDTRAVAESNLRSIKLQDKSEVCEVAGVLSDSACSSVLPDNDGVKAAKLSESMEVGAYLMRFIRGKGGAMQKSIEEEMGVNIIFPSDSKEESIVIQGDSAEKITKAAEKIQTIINETVKSPYFKHSHFISLPLAKTPELVEKLIGFQNSILGNNSEEETKANLDLGIDKSIFTKPERFHLTVLMLKLWRKGRVDAAKEVLESISAEVMSVLDGRPLSVRLKGLACMQESPDKARVLYAPVEDIGNEDRLMRACHACCSSLSIIEVIIDAYKKADLVLEQDAQHELKLHATLMSAGYRKRMINDKEMDSFDARGIFEKYGTEEWGECHIHEAHLSQRGVFDDNDYNHCCASLPFP